MINMEDVHSRAQRLLESRELYLSPDCYDKVNKDRLRRFLAINGIVHGVSSVFVHKVRGKFGYPDLPPFHDHARIYFKKNGQKICVIHEYIKGDPKAGLENIMDRSIEWALRWGYVCEVYPPDAGWYFPDTENGPGAACIIFHKRDVEVLMPE